MGKLRPALERWGLFAGILALYLLLPTRRYYWDGISFAQVIEDVPRLHPHLIHPNHLLYNVFGYASYKFVGLIGIPARSLHVLQFANSLLSVICAYVFFLILKASFGSRYLIYALTLLFAFSATWWRFSTDAGAYIPSILLLLISFRLIHPKSNPRPVLVAAFHAGSILFHQLAVLFAPVALLGILYQASLQTKRSHVALMCRYLAVICLVTVPMYYWCFYLREGSVSFGEFIRWTVSHSDDSHFTFSVWNNFAASLDGHVRIFFGSSGRLPWTLSLNNWLVAAVLPGLVAAVALLGITLIKDIGAIRQFFRFSKTTLRKPSALLVLSLVWCGSYLVFLFFFLPQNTFYRMFYLPAIVLMFGVFLSGPMDSSDHTRRHRTALVVAIVMGFNLFFLIFPYSRIQGNPPLDLALRMNRDWPQKTVIYYTGLNTDDMLIRYFNPNATWRRCQPGVCAVPENDLREVYLNGGTAWINTVSIDALGSNSAGRTWLEEHTRDRPRWELVNKRHRIQYFQIVPKLVEGVPRAGKPTT